MDSKLTIIAIVRDWNKEHEQKFFDSVMSQTVGTKLILIDYNSKKKYSDWLKVLTEKYDFIEIIKVSGDDKFRKSYALNIGIQRTKTDYILFTDIDCILSPNVVEECLKNLTDTENSLIFSEKILVSPRGVILGRFSGSSGGCIAGKTEWFRKIRGFDEVYTGFSFEDRDIIHRARLDRLKVIDIFDKVKILHQCHRGRKGKNENYLKQKEYYINNRSVIRNLEKWGEVVN